MGSVIIAIIYGNVSMYIANYTANTTAYQRKMELLFESMTHLELPQNLKKRILMYYDHIWKEYRTLDGTITYFIPELSKQLSSEVYLYLRTNLILSVPFLRQCSPEVVRELVLRLKSEIFLPADYIVHKGAPGAEMFLISKGICEVTVPDIQLENKEVTEAKKRKRQQGRRRSSADIIVGAVENFSDFIQKRNQKAAEMKEKEANPLELDAETNLPKEEQRKNYLSQPAPSSISKLRLKTFRLADMPGITDMPGMGGVKKEKEKEPEEEPLEMAGTSFGKARIIKKEKVVKELVSGEYFGEICLVLNTARTCNIRAKTFCELHILMAKDFNEVVVQFEDERKVLEEIIMEKYKDEASKWELQKKKKDFDMEDFVNLETNNQMQHDNTSDMLKQVMAKMVKMADTMDRMRRSNSNPGSPNRGSQNGSQSSEKRGRQRAQSDLTNVSENDSEERSSDEDRDQPSNEAVELVLSGDIPTIFKQARKNLAIHLDKLNCVIREIRGKAAINDFHVVRLKTLNNDIKFSWSQVDQIQGDESNKVLAQLKYGLLNDLEAMQMKTTELIDEALKLKVVKMRLEGQGDVSFVFDKQNEPPPKEPPAMEL